MNVHCISWHNHLLQRWLQGTSTIISLFSLLIEVSRGNFSACCWTLFFQPFFRKRMYKSLPINKCILSIQCVSTNPGLSPNVDGWFYKTKTFTLFCSWLHLKPGGCSAQLGKIPTPFPTHWNTMPPLIPQEFWRWCCQTTVSTHHYIRNDF